MLSIFSLSREILLGDPKLSCLSDSDANAVRYITQVIGCGIGITNPVFSGRHYEKMVAHLQKGIMANGCNSL